MVDPCILSSTCLVSLLVLQVLVVGSLHAGNVCLVLLVKVIISVVVLVVVVVLLVVLIGGKESSKAGGA